LRAAEAKFAAELETPPGKHKESPDA